MDSKIETAAQEEAKIIAQDRKNLKNTNILERYRVLRNEKGFNITESRIVMKRAREILEAGG